MRQMAMPGSTDEIDEIEASLLRALTSAHRHRIIHRLGIGLCEFNELAPRPRPEPGVGVPARGLGACGRVRRGRPRATHRARWTVRSGDPRRLQHDCAARTSGGSPGSATPPAACP